jgi:endonuclease/exonuclease/phosphatase family metal-dependent hydrolase
MTNPSITNDSINNLKQIKLVTFNAWLLRTPVGLDISKDIDKRVKIIPQSIADTGADIIFLQEVWGEKIQEDIIQQFKNLGYEYFVKAYEKNILSPIKSFFGNGLLIISKFPVKNNPDFLVFDKYTRFDENFVNKGAIHAQVYIKGVGEIDLFNAHLGAVTYISKNQSYNQKESERRYLQAKQLVHWIREIQSYSKISIIAVDLNAHDKHYEQGRFVNKSSKEYALFTDNCDYGNLNMIDTFKFFNKNNSNKQESFSYDRKNFYVSDGYFKEGPSENLDYIFISKRPESFIQSSSLVFKEKFEVISENDKKVNIGLSDHYGIMTTLMVPMREKIGFDFNQSISSKISENQEVKVQ